MSGTVSPDAIIEEFNIRREREGLGDDVVQVYLVPAGDLLSLDYIKSHDTGKGYADRVLTILTELCDEYHKDIELTVHPIDETDETSAERLEKWYMRHGFVNADSEESVMRRNCRPRGRSLVTSFG